jgi:hypothetical protein
MFGRRVMVEADTVPLYSKDGRSRPDLVLMSTTPFAALAP